MKDKKSVWVESWLTMGAPQFLLLQQFESGLEEQYRAFYVKLFARMRIRAAKVGMIMWASFVALDLIRASMDSEYGEVLFEISSVRVLVLICLCVFFRAMLRPDFESDDGYANKVLLGGMVVLFSGMSALIVIAPSPYREQSFYTGMMVCIVGVFSLFALRAREAIYLAGIMTIGSLLALVIGMIIEPVGLIGKLRGDGVVLVFLICFIVIGVTLCLLHESMTRKLFESQHALALSSQEAARQQAELIEMKEVKRSEAVQQSRDKSIFIASAVHDIRQPVQALTSVSIPLRQAISSARTEKALALFTIVDSAIGILQHQLGAILDISRIEAGEMKPSIEDFDLRHLIQDVIASMSILANEKEVKIIFNDSEGVVHIFSDFQFLRRMVTNIVENGLKYADSKKRPDCYVTLAMDVHQNHVTLLIQDNGIGIPGAYLEGNQLFQPFFQVGNRDDQKKNGFGLGLAIVKGMVDQLPGHAIELQSEVGRGTTFKLKLPLASTNSTSESDRSINQDPLLTDQLKGVFIILVEDDVNVRNATSEFLHDQGAVCECFDSLASISEGLDDMARTPDVIISDYSLTDGATAEDVIHLLTERFGPRPTIVLSGSEPPRSLMRQFPYIKVLRKPIEMMKLEGEVVKQIGTMPTLPQ